MNRICLCCNHALENGATTCHQCGLQDMSEMTWIPDELKNQFVTIRKPINPTPTLDDIKTIADKASHQCNFDLDSISIKKMDEALLDTVIDNGNSHTITIHCNLSRMRCYSKEELLTLLREQIMFAKTFDKGAPFTPVQAPQQQIDYRLELKLAYDAFVAYKEYVKIFPNDSDYHSAKRLVFTSFSVEYLTTKYQLNNLQDFPFLQPAISALNMYQDAAYYFFEGGQKLDDWVAQNDCKALYTFWKWFQEDFTFIEKYTSCRGETEKLLQLTELLSSCVFSGNIFTANELGFLPTFDTNMNLCEQNTTNPTGKAIIKSWRIRFNNSPYKF